MQENRNYSLDVIRGVAILLVVIGHCIQYFSAGTSFDFFNNGVFKFIYSFHMPLFVLLSGYSFVFTIQKRGFKEILLRNIKQLLIPLVIWNTINYVIISVPFSGSWLTVLKGYLVQMRGGLWFIWCILFCSITVAFVVKFFNNREMRFAAYLAAFLLFCLAPSSILPAKRFLIWLFPYYFLGYIFHIEEKRFIGAIEKHKAKIIPFLIVAYVLLLLFYRKECYIYTSGISLINSSYGIWMQLLIDIYRWIIGLVGSVAIVLVVEGLLSLSTMGGVQQVFCHPLGKVLYKCI